MRALTLGQMKALVSTARRIPAHYRSQQLRIAIEKLEDGIKHRLDSNVRDEEILDGEIMQEDDNA